MIRRSSIALCSALLSATIGCGPAGGDGNANTNDNDNGNGGGSETRDFTGFTVFTYNAGSLDCAGIGELAEATVVDLREQAIGIRVDLTFLEAGDPDVDVCVDAPAERGCLVLNGPETRILEVTADQDVVLSAFAAVTLMLDTATDCTESRCDDSFNWDAEEDFSSADCAVAPRLSASEAARLIEMLVSFR